MTTMEDRSSPLIEGMDDGLVTESIREWLAPRLNAADDDDTARKLEELRVACERVLLPLREFLESEMPEHDYAYNDVVGYEEGKWSAEVHVMLEPGVEFTDDDVELLRALGRPIWLLTIELSLVLPFYMMMVERWELSPNRTDWIECSTANDRASEFAQPIDRCRAAVEQMGFRPLPTESLGRIPTREQIGAKLVLGQEPEELTLVQLLFNELFETDLELLER